MFPGSTVKEELHLIFRLLGESSAVSRIPTRGQCLTAGAVTQRSLASLAGARGQAAWAGSVGRRGQAAWGGSVGRQRGQAAWAEAARSPPPGLQSAEG